MKSLLACFSLLIFFLPFSAKSNNFDVEEISVQPLNNVIHRTGKLDFKRTLSLSFKSSGYLTKLSVDEGDYFDHKQLLASMDNSELI